jgi:GT2 family glycosyltransferase
MIAGVPSTTGREEFPTASIVIPVLNQVAYTRRCIEHLEKHTDIPYELILIDNASTDGTAVFLQSLRARVITNTTNRGCAGAWNQGIGASRGRYIVLLSNDVLVTRGWLGQLVSFMEAEGHGIVSPAVRAGRLDYDLSAYAQAFTGVCARATRPDPSSCCLVVAREVFDRVGLFDEQFRIGTFEDMDFKWRARRAGVTMAMTGAVLVHHFGEVTQHELRKILGDYGRENAARFVAKWGRGVEGGWFVRRGGRLRRFTQRVYERLRYGHTLTEVG